MNSAEELSAIICAGQDHSLEVIHVTVEQALEDLALLMAPIAFAGNNLFRGMNLADLMA